MKPNAMMLLMTGLSLAVMLAIPSQLKNTKAVAANPVENNIWQKGSFPVENFQNYSSGFGYREYPYQGFHYGLDLAAPQGSYIRSWWSGKIVEVWSDSKCGTGIMIQSGNWKHIYCHLKDDVLSADGRPYLIDRDGGIQLWQGQQVLTGQRIGRVGMSGRTNGPHLHWGLKHANQWVDPALVLKAMYSSGSCPETPTLSFACPATTWVGALGHERQNPHWQRAAQRGAAIDNCYCAIRLT